MQQLFKHHLQQLQQLAADALFRCRLQGMWLHAGMEENYFLDDQAKPFKINPLFNYFVPNPRAVGAWLYVDGSQKPKLYFYAPQDYWHCTETLNDEFWTAEFDVTILRRPQEIVPFLSDIARCAYVGAQTQWAAELGFGEINPQKLLNIFHYQRAVKTDYELACLRKAQHIALKGHEQVRRAYAEPEASEFGLHLAYLAATAQMEQEVPYGNIIAYNQHAAILHYTRLAVQPPAQKHSLLIDAGASYLGYAADITRTYAIENNEFQALIHEMDELKLRIIDNLQAGYNYLSYHTQMQQDLSQLLHEFEFIRLPPEAIFEEGISRSFCPHGLGHLLGLQVHDAGGFLQNSRGTHKAAPEIYPSLRCTRDLLPDMVLTVEPGLYFIDMLLDPWRKHKLSPYFNWEKIDSFRQYGGIRTEDNVRILPQGVENLTQDAQRAMALD